MQPIHIIFVCHGNICRSPMAEFIMKDLVTKNHVAHRFVITSAAATREEIGCDMYPPAKRMLTAKGVPFAKHAAHLFTKEEYKEADYVIAMDSENLEDLHYLTGGDPQKKVSLLLSHAGRKGEVADPWYTGDFEETYRDIILGCRGLLKELGAIGLVISD